MPRTIKFPQPNGKVRKVEVNRPMRVPAGGGLLGYVDISYDELVKILGRPQIHDHKVTREWRLVGFGAMATIYDYKRAKKTEPLKSFRDWHVGGSSEASVKLVEQVLGRFVHRE